MVSDNRGRITFRVCPTIEGEEGRPLFQQNITEDTCLKRQERSYHKCHRCSLREPARLRDHLVKISMM